MWSQVLNWIGSGAITLLAVSVPAASNAQEAKQSMERILQVWKERQERATSIRFRLTTEKTIHEGSTSYIVNLDRRLRGQSDLMETNPPRDYIVNGTTEVTISNQKLRYTYDEEEWNPTGKRLYKAHNIEVFDGKLYKYLRDPASGREDHPTGGVRIAKGSRSTLPFRILPLLWAFRGRHSQFFKNIEEYQLTGQIVSVGERPCLELERKPKDKTRELIYVDRERDYVVVKEMILHSENPQWQLNITYSQDGRVGWIPRSWEYIMRVGKEGRMSSSGQMMVNSYDINPQLDDDIVFNIVFPPRTRVHDRTSDAPVQYVVSEDGEKGRVIPDAAIPTYEDLREPSSKIKRWALLISWSVILVLAIGVWAFLRPRRRSQRVQGS